MKLLFEVIIYCFVYTLFVKIAKRNNPLNCLYFYPESVRKKAYSLGLADEQSVHKRAKCFYTYFLTALAILLFVFMVIPETVDIPHLKPWKTVLVRRTLGTIAYIPIAAVFALIFSRLSICIWNGCLA